MKIICAPDSFKESVSAARAARCMAEGIRERWPNAEVDACPISDGGEGFAQAVGMSLGAEAVTTRVVGPRGEAVDARWYFADGHEGRPATGVIEMATASGLELTGRDQRDPMKTTSYGTGQLIAAAIARGARRIVMGIGGSATNDFACGAAQAMGARFYDGDGVEMTEPMAGGVLSRIGRVEVEGLKGMIEGVEFVVASDVTNPLSGREGAAYVYGPQKGADAAAVERLDAGLVHIGQVVREQLGVDVANVPGAGAAGGMGGGAMAFFGASLRRGIELVLDTVDFDRRVADCVVCLTGEGKLDGQSLSGKACMGVVNAAAKRGVRTYALIGAAGEGIERAVEAGLAGYRVIGPDLPVEESIRRGEELLRKATYRLIDELELDARTANTQRTD